MVKYIKPERILLKGHAELNEKWVQERIAEDPSLLGLGDLILRYRLTGWLEASLGGGFWSDLVTSPSGNKQTFSKFTWGIAIPF